MFLSILCCLAYLIRLPFCDPSLAKSNLEDLYLKDSIVGDLDSMIAVLVSDDGLSSQMQLTSIYTKTEQYTEARSVLTTLADNELCANYCTITNEVIDLKEQGLSLAELSNDANFMALLDSIVDDTLSHGYADARVLNEMLTGVRHYETVEEWIGVSAKMDQSESIVFEKNNEELSSKQSTAINFKLYPNPTTGNLTLEYTLKGTDVGKFEIWDMTGKRVLDMELLPSVTSQNLLINETLSSGIYHYKLIVNEEPVMMDKLIVISK